MCMRRPAGWFRNIPTRLQCEDGPSPQPSPRSGAERGRRIPLLTSGATILILISVSGIGRAQSLINIDFGVGSQSAKVGFAATGQATNDFWNVYRHYDPKFLPGMPLVYDGLLQKLKHSDGSESKVSLAVTNAPGVWGN